MEVLNPRSAVDELAIRALPARFADAVNRGATAEMAALFTADGRWLVPGCDVAEGPTAVEALLTKLLDGFEVLVQIVHQGEVRVDRDEAAARWYIEEAARDSGGTGWRFIGTYHDRYRRTEAGWRFEYRRFDFIYRGRTELPGRAHPVPDLTGEWRWVP